MQLLKVLPFYYFRSLNVSLHIPVNTSKLVKIIKKGFEPPCAKYSMFDGDVVSWERTLDYLNLGGKVKFYFLFFN